MGNLGALDFDTAGADKRRTSIESSDLTAAPTDAWGRPLPDQETDDDEADRLLLAINWLCELLERMNDAPEAAAADVAAYHELMQRLQRSSRSRFVRDRLDLVAEQAAAGCYGDAVDSLRGLIA